MMTSICPDKAKEPDATEHRVLLTIAAALLLIFRRPESILNPQFWAEDATVFFAGAHQYGLASVWQTHAGYFVLLPRIIAFLALKVPLLHVPFFYNVAAASLILVVFYLILTSRLPRSLRIGFSFSILLVPQNCEVFSNITNVQWVVSVLLLLLVFQERPTNTAQLVRDICIVFLAGLTGPILALVFPFVVARAFFPTVSRRMLFVAFAAVGVSLLQIAIVVSSERVGINVYSSFLETLPRVLMDFTPSLLMGVLIPRFIPMISMGVGLLVIIAVILTILKAKDRVLMPVVVCFLISISLWIVSVTVSQPGFAKFGAFAEGGRYYYLPYVLIAWGLIYISVYAPGSGKFLGRYLLIAIVVSSASKFAWFWPYDYSWAKQVAEYRQGKRDTFIFPPGWVLSVRTMGPLP